MTWLKTLFGSSIDYNAAASGKNYTRTPLSGYEGNIVSVTKQFTFEAGHYVPDHKARCKYVHGHSYKLFVTIEGPINDEGMVIDFQDLSKIVNDIIEPYDHGFLNDYYSFPTAEVMASHIMNLVQEKLSKNLTCTEIKLYETEKCCATVTNRRCHCHE